jgi:hypothetical protein
MLPSKREAFWKFKMKPLPLMIRVFIARGDYLPTRAPTVNDVSFEE